MELHITQTRHTLSILQKKITKFKTPENEKKNHEMYTKRGTHLQYSNNYYAKFEYKRMKTVGVTDYTSRHPLCISDGKMSMFNIRKSVKIFIKFAQNRKCTSSMCEPSLFKVLK